MHCPAIRKRKIICAYEVWLKNNGTGRPADMVEDAQTIETHDINLQHIAMVRAKRHPATAIVSFLELFLSLMFDGLVTARPQLIVGYLDDVLHVLEKPKVPGSEGWLVRRVLKYCDLLLAKNCLTLMEACASALVRDPAFSSWSLNDPA